jgi:hypothetical protein
MKLFICKYKSDDYEFGKLVILAESEEMARIQINEKYGNDYIIVSAKTMVFEEIPLDKPFTLNIYQGE